MLQRVLDLGGRQPGRLRQLLDRRLLAVLGFEPGPRGADLDDRVVHGHGQPDRPLVGGDPALDGLADPPGGVRGELEALAPLELLHRADQTEVALLDELIQAELGAVGELGGDVDDQAQVGGHEVVEGVLSTTDLAFEATAVGFVELTGFQGGCSGVAEFDGLGKAHLVSRREQVHGAEFIEVEVQKVLRNGSHQRCSDSLWAGLRAGRACNVVRA